MEQQRKARNLIIILLLTIATSSSNQNHYTYTAIDVGSTSSNPIIDYTSLRSANTTTSIHQDSTTYLPALTKTEDEILDSSETKRLSHYAQPSYSHNEYIEEDDNSDEDFSDHVIPYSVHEEETDVPTRPKYVAPGNWATPPPEKNIPLDFVPVKLHAQVRGTHTVKRLPRREAIESAETDEEKLNAHRLREVVTNSKVNTVYTEEGYEDSAYDHAGHVRDADFHEGYARKLHDRQKSGRNSSSGKHRTGKNSNLVPDEFKNYDEDYQDHAEENRKYGNSRDNLIGGNIWEGSEIDPKLVVETGIQKLEEDTEKEAEESEKNSKIYQNAQESKLHNDIDSESEDSEDENDLKNEENKPTKTKKKKVDTLTKEGKKLHKSNQKKKLYDENYETTVDPFDKIKTNSTDIKASETPENFVTNSSISQAYSTDKTSHFIAPVDEPTTISYSQLFWDYFKARNSPSSTDTSYFFSNSTMNPQPEERTPIAVATIDGHGPYLFVTTEETTRTPSTFFNSRTFYPELFSDSVNSFGSNSNHNRHLLGHSDDVDFTNVFVATTDATLPNKTSNLLQSSSSNSENIERSSSTSLDNVTSTPTVITLNITKEALSKLDDYKENPFLGPILDNSNIPFLKNNLSKNNNNLKYKVLVRPEPKKSAKSVGDQSSSRQHASSPLVSQQEEEHKRNRDELSAKYNKMLNYIKNKQSLRSSPEKKKVIYPDFNLMRPPTSQRIAYSIFPTNRPTITNRPSVSVESESLRESKKDLSQDQQHRSQAIKSNPYPFIYVQPVYHKNPLPATKLLPPPLPSIADNYGNYHNNRQNNYHSSHIKPLQQQQQQRDNAFRYLPLVPDATRRIRSRRKRSGEFHDAVIDVKAMTNKAMTNSSETEEQRDEDTTKLAFLVRSRGTENEASATLERKNSTVGNSESKSAEDLRKLTIDSSTLVDKESLLRSQRNVRNKKGHEELLNESPKISGYVIDKEIATRFNDNDEKDDETSTEIKEEDKVEVEIPNFDYVEELADEEVPEPSTTTEVAVDSKKYPFYNDENIPKASALKYVIDPKLIPRKTSSGMEFYDSRNKQCDEVEPNLDEVLPEKEEPNPEREPPENLPRLRGLGDKLDCFKAKYFDDNPFDNPLFAEKFIEEPTLPSELNPTKFASKIMVLPEENDDYVVHQVSKKPERNGRQMKNRNRPYQTQESIRVNYKHDSLNGRGRNAYLHTMRGSRLPARRLKNQRSRLKFFSSTTTQSPRPFQTASYQNQVYEDVMGNIRNMANSYQVYEMTTSLPSTQILATAGSENKLKIASVLPSSSREKTTLSPDDVDVSTIMYENTKSSEIKGLIPPPKYLTPQQTGYRKHRPSGKNRVLMRSSNIPRIIAHHTIKINKRSAKNDVAHDSFNNTDKNKTLITKSAKDVVENDTVVHELVEETTTETTLMPEIMDLETEESRQIRMQDQNCATNLKIDVKKNRRNFTNNDQSSEPPQKTIYTIKDRIKHSKPRWETRGFGKFSTKPQTIDEDNRRKEPRYNYFRRKKKPVDDENNYTTLNSVDSSSIIKNAPLLIEDVKTSTTEIYHAEESVVYHTIYRNEEEYREPGNAESTVDTKSERKSAEEETEETTNTYKVHEDVDENASPPTTTKSTNSKEVLDLREYLESNPPGYEETFSEETTTSSNKYRDQEEEQNEEINYPKTESSLSNEDSSEKVEEQVETPMKTKSFARDDDSEELVSKEEEGSDKKTFFTYLKRPSSVEHDEESTERTSYSSFPFSRYKSKIKTESDEDETKETSEETSEDYVFPWHADREYKKSKPRWLQNFDRFEYPWERRERLARERRNKQKRANRFRKMIFDDDDEDDEEEHTRDGRPTYAWEKYDVPSKSRVKNNRRDILRDISRDFSRRNIEGNSEEYTTEQVLPTTRFNKKYNSRNIRPVKSSSAREISRSIEKLLKEDDFNEEASKKFKDDHSSVARNSSSDKEISRGTLVPEDVTQTPRKKDKKRRKIPQPAKNVTDNSDLDSKKVENKEVNDKANEDEYSGVDYFKLRKNNVNDTEMQIETTTINHSSELFNSTEEIPAATTTQRKKRRRKPLKNNSAISLDNAAAESVAELTTKRRRKSQVTTTTTTTPITSATPLARIDLAVSKSFFIPVRAKYTRTGEVAKTNELNPFKETIAVQTVPETTKFNRLRVKTSTPNTRTIEHRSSVSKQKIVTKTIYPNEADNFNSKINATFAQKQEEEKMKPKVRRRRKNKLDDDTKYNNNENLNNTEKLMKRENEQENSNTKSVNKDETQKVIISEKPQVRNNFGIQQEAEKQINDLNNENINDENNDTNDFGIMSEVSLSPNQRTVELTHYGSKIMSAMSWISENYDY